MSRRGDDNEIEVYPAKGERVTRKNRNGKQKRGGEACPGFPEAAGALAVAVAVNQERVEEGGP